MFVHKVLRLSPQMVLATKFCNRFARSSIFIKNDFFSQGRQRQHDEKLTDCCLHLLTEI